ncbi:glycosyltransferase [Pedobacter sp. LMG 31464]|uniref:Glycosyltransferase n=1 Tax=Pedobacter planticolens TaxID=2679964 RepID=A0A923IUD4_9SPHI|nr:glycosyltransferase family 2 protein [Pedobacter planticolens]MBB2144658.1 glycosyltransferase [Pedobacter planticolens]
MIPVSIVIITKNEAALIANCITACKPISDDIIIIDNDSTDYTPKIAESLGCRVFLENWDGYGANKNKGGLLAKYDWILSIDADEIPDAELITALHQLSFNDSKVVYDIKFKTYFGKKIIQYGSWGNNHKIRLFNRIHVKWSNSKVHETLLLPNFTNIKRLKGHIDHFTVQSVQEFYQKANHYANLSTEQYLINNKKNVFLKLYLSPIFGFIKNYIIRLGFLDGAEGLDIALITYKNTWSKYYRLKQLQRKLDSLSTKTHIIKDFDMEYK